MMPRITRWTLPLILVLTGCASFDERTTRVPDRLERDVDLHGTLAFRCGDYYLTETPSTRALETLERRGVSIVLDLRDPAAAIDDPVRVEAQRFGLEYVQQPLQRGGWPSDDYIDELVAEIDAFDGRIGLVFCDRGTNTAMMFAIFRASVIGVDADQAVEEALKVGMPAGESEAFVRGQIERLKLKRAQTNSVSSTITSATRSASASLRQAGGIA